MVMEPPSQRTDYNLLWWIGSDPRRYEMIGSLNNTCVIIPEAELILIRLQQYD